MEAYYRSGRRQTFQEMCQKPVSRDTFFSLKDESYTTRPTSVATEFVDTDWDEDDIVSEPEDNSPRISLQSSGQPSFTTVSSYDEVPTPRTSRQGYVEMSGKPVEGPRGPHLFRDSQIQPLDDEDIILTLSPLTPKVSRGFPEPFHRTLPPPRRNSPFQYTRQELDTSTLVSWTPEMVAQSMLNAGIELNTTDRFIENDINGAILITLKFEDLRELDIPSFGIRTRVWHQIEALRDSGSASSPRPPTPIEDEPSREVRRETRGHDGSEMRRRVSSRKQPRTTDTIMPGESVSIIGIEQVIPKPHVCSKGENCSKFRKQARLIERFKKLNPNIDVDANAGGTVMIVGDAGNPGTARAIDPNETMRPMSDGMPSVVASSDVLGGGVPAFKYLQETTLRNLQSRDAQDNVRHFIHFQHNNGNEVPPTPPFEVTPAAAPHQGLRRLPRLSIPTAPAPVRPQPPRAATVPPQTQQHLQQQYYERPQHENRHSIQQSPERFVPYQMGKADPLSPDLETDRNPYRFGTPFSDMDVPVTAVAAGLIARDASQSVPPDMNYCHTNSNSLARTQSRASSRRPSFPVLPALDENRSVRVMSKTPSPLSLPRASIRPLQQPLQAPPRATYPWSPIERTNFEQAIPPMSTLTRGEASSTSAHSNGITYQGVMKKRKTKMLRNEWQDGYFTIKGTRLNMHRDSQHIDRTLEYVDIDDYAIACSSVASTSKLSAAFKAVRISHKREKSDPVGAFQFQLIPQDKEKVGARLRKRDSIVSPGPAPLEGVNGTGKTHHFAVNSRDERIDWMRELMLAKALKQKGDGFEIGHNGSMI